MANEVKFGDESDNAIIDILFKDKQPEGNDVTKRLLDEMKQTIQAELKVVCTLIGNLKEKVNTLVDQIDDVKDVHVRCTEHTTEHRAKIADRINALQIEINELRYKDINELRHKDIDKAKFDELKERVAETKATVDAMRKWMYILGSAVIVALIKLMMGLVIK